MITVQVSRDTYLCSKLTYNVHVYMYIHVHKCLYVCVLYCLFQAWMDKYFARIVSLSTNEELPPRIRFMLLNVADLRKGNVRNCDNYKKCAFRDICSGQGVWV